MHGQWRELKVGNLSAESRHDAQNLVCSFLSFWHRQGYIFVEKPETNSDSMSSPGLVVLRFFFMKHGRITGEHNIAYPCCGDK